jgi:type IV secretory pathway VirB2 component (pilin)
METWVGIFVIVAAVAIVLQMAILFGMYKTFQQTSAKLTQTSDELRAKLDPVLSRLHMLLEDLSPRLSSAAADATEMTHLARIQAERLDRVFLEAVDRLRLLVIRADQMMSGALETVENTGAQVRRSLLGPVQEVSALLKGIHAGMDVLRGSRRRTERVRESTEEELFI